MTWLPKNQSHLGIKNNEKKNKLENTFAKKKTKG